jgi:hypothetical protein
MPSPLVEGGIYGYRASRLRWGIFKVLKLDPEVAHIRMYSNSYWRPPAQESLGELELAPMPRGWRRFLNPRFGIGHLPMSRSTVAGWSGFLITRVEVQEEELEGYKIWLEAGGEGVWA